MKRLLTAYLSFLSPNLTLAYYDKVCCVLSVQGQPQIRGMTCSTNAYGITADFRLHNRCLILHQRLSCAACSSSGLYEVSNLIHIWYDLPIHLCEQG